MAFAAHTIYTMDKDSLFREKQQLPVMLIHEHNNVEDIVVWFKRFWIPFESLTSLQKWLERKYGSTTGSHINFR